MSMSDDEWAVREAWDGVNADYGSPGTYLRLGLGGRLFLAWTKEGRRRRMARSQQVHRAAP
jgi:hypothetical protein